MWGVAAGNVSVIANPLALRLAAQRKSKGLRAFAQSLLTAGLELMLHSTG